jgi:hypothetical protein
MIFRPSTTSGSRLHSLGALCAVLVLPLSACALIGVEPEEIDYLDGESGSEAATGEGNGDGDGDGDPGGDGDGDGDPGDGDGDTGDGDGDGDPGDGDGDGDGDPLGCEEFNPLPLVEGSNPIMIIDGNSLLEASCGAPGPETVYAFTAPIDGLAQFTLSGATFEAALYVVALECNPLEEIACAAAPTDPLMVEQLMTADQTYYIVVDSFAGGGDATLDVTIN